MTTPARLAIIVVILILIGGIAFALWHQYAKAPIDVLSTPINSVSYTCMGGATISAAYYDGPTKASTDPSMPPTPGGSVALTLSDGRTMTLAQTLSADGARYANMDETFVFWNKGNGALVLENSQEKNYKNCVQDGGPVSGNPDMRVYTNATAGYSVMVPTSYSADEQYTYQVLGPGKSISGTKFTVPASFTEGTNLSKDSYISIETLPNSASCTAALFVETGATVSTVTMNGKKYSMASVTGAAAGNRYEEIVFALPTSTHCLAIRYFMHSTVLENYPAGTKTAFNKSVLVQQFDSIRDTLTLTP